MIKYLFKKDRFREKTIQTGCTSPVLLCQVLATAFYQFIIAYTNYNNVKAFWCNKQNTIEGYFFFFGGGGGSVSLKWKCYQYSLCLEAITHAFDQNEIWLIPICGLIFVVKDLPKYTRSIHFIMQIHTTRLYPCHYKYLHTYIYIYPYIKYTQLSNIAFLGVWFDKGGAAAQYPSDVCATSCHFILFFIASQIWLIMDVDP